MQARGGQAGTYGCLWVGNRAFLDAWESKVAEQWRTFNERDTVPTVPRSTGFTQTARGVCLMEHPRKGGAFAAAPLHDERAAFFCDPPAVTLGGGLRVTDEVRLRSSGVQLGTLRWKYSRFVRTTFLDVKWNNPAPGVTLGGVCASSTRCGQ